MSDGCQLSPPWGMLTVLWSRFTIFMYSLCAPVFQGGLKAVVWTDVFQVGIHLHFRRGFPLICSNILKWLIWTWSPICNEWNNEQFCPPDGDNDCGLRVRPHHVYNRPRWDLHYHLRLATRRETQLFGVSAFLRVRKQLHPNFRYHKQKKDIFPFPPSFAWQWGMASALNHVLQFLNKNTFSVRYKTGAAYTNI